eukprot:scaffold90482_cov52-Attheya_sp.AAC.3
MDTLSLERKEKLDSIGFLWDPFSVGEKDLALFEEFAETQQAGRGEAANNFKFGGDEAAAVAEDEMQDYLYA